MTPPRRERTELQTEHDAGELIYRLSHTIGDTISATSHTSMVGFAAMLGLEVPGYLLPQREWWRRYRITSGQNPIVEHDSLLSFIRAESPRGLTRGSGKPERTLALLFALVDESEDKELGARVLAYLEQHGVTRDAITVAAASPMPAQEIGKGKPGPGRGGKTDSGATRLKVGRGSEYLAKRLKRDHPDLAARVEAGGLSIRQAATEAGIVRKPTPLAQLRKAWGAAPEETRLGFLIEAWGGVSEEDRAEFLRGIGATIAG